ncbi:MAG: menaquinone biosynthesis decarboxylase [Armatimonadota bacterium]
MAYLDLQKFINHLEKNGELKKISIPVDPVLEITEVADRVVKAEGPALFFENPVGSSIPVLIGAMASERRMAMALGVESINCITEEILDLVKLEIPDTLMSKLLTLPKYGKLATYIPKNVSSGRCQDVVITDNPSLDMLPILHCWPGDGGRFITLPMVFTKDPNTGMRNVGMYRMHVYDSTTTGMHWHPHKTGARHYAGYEKQERRMELAVALGGDPAITFAATAPLPDDLDEMLFAGFLRKKSVEMVKCKTINIEVPAESDIVIEGYIDPHERRIEGPFGDHTGYYSLCDEFPVFHVTAITHRNNPVYPATIVGRPPMEDCFMAKAIERIFMPLIKLQLPEIVDMNLPIEGVFHNLAVVSIKKRFPGHARKIMHAIWGMGQMMFTKIIVVVDEHVNVQDLSEVLWRLGNNIDPQRDIEFVQGPVDILDHASRLFGYGSKMGIDATKKLAGEGFTREWPDEIKMSPDVRKKIDGIWSELGLG